MDRLLNALENRPPPPRPAEGAGETGLPPCPFGAGVATVSECPVELELADVDNLGVEIGVRFAKGIFGDGGSWSGGGGIVNGDTTPTLPEADLARDDEDSPVDMTDDIFKLIGAPNFGSLENDVDVEDDIPPVVVSWILSSTFSLINPQCLNNHPSTL